MTNGESPRSKDSQAGAGRSPVGARRRALIVLGVLALAVASAWIVQNEVVGEGAEAPGGGSAPSYSVAVMQGGRLLRRFTVADLRALQSVTATIEGKEQDGPAVTTLLTAAGAGTYQTLSVKGIGARDSGRLSLDAAGVNDRLMLDFSDRGTVKICSPDLEWNQWVRDVVEIDLD